MQNQTDSSEVVDGHVVVLAIASDLQRYGMQQVLSQVPTVLHVHAARDLSQALSALDGVPFPIVVLAVNALDATMHADIAEAAHLGVRVLALFDEEAVPVDQVVGLPVAGFLDARDVRPSQVTTILDQIGAGEVAFPDSLKGRLLSIARSAAGANRGLPRLTPREQETLVLLVDGLSNKQIARRLGISDHGAKRLVANIMGKLDCPNRTLVVARALRAGLVAGG
jgi:two-component system, NarL family, nitrate/nitrite response regulator NarL